MCTEIHITAPTPSSDKWKCMLIYCHTNILLDFYGYAGQTHYNEENLYNHCLAS